MRALFGTRNCKYTPRAGQPPLSPPCVCVLSRGRGRGRGRGRRWGRRAGELAQTHAGGAPVKTFGPRKEFLPGCREQRGRARLREGLEFPRAPLGGEPLLMRDGVGL